MKDPLIPPLFILVGTAFVGWGGLKLRATLSGPASGFKIHRHAPPGGRFESLVARASGAFDGVSVLLLGAVVFAFGLLDLLG